MLLEYSVGGVMSGGHGVVGEGECNAAWVGKMKHGGGGGR